MQTSASKKSTSGGLDARPFKVYTARDLDSIPQLRRLPPEERFAMRVVASVLPFRVNEYVVEELIDWGRVPDDPLFQLTVPQRGMLAPHEFDRIADIPGQGRALYLDGVVPFGSPFRRIVLAVPHVGVLALDHLLTTRQRAHKISLIAALM